MKRLTLAGTAATILTAAATAGFAGAPAASADTLPAYNGSELQSVFTTEKIAPGVVLHHIVDVQSPNSLEGADTLPSSQTYNDIQALVVNLNTPGVRIGPMTSSGSLNTTENPSTMAAQNGAVAAINGSYFTFGAYAGGEATDENLVQNGTVEATASDVNSGTPTDGGWHDLSQLADGSFSITPTLAFSGTVSVNEGARTFALTGMNVAQGDGGNANAVVEYTPQWGTETRSFTMNGPSGVEEVVVGANNQVTAVNSSITAAAIPTGGFVLEGIGTGATELSTLAVGDTITAKGSITLNGQTPQWTLGGDQQILADGTVEESAEIFEPRTAVGISQDGKTVIFMVAEGRGTLDPGIHDSELAQVMKQLGAYNAMSYDGGGSSELVARPIGGTVPTIRDDPSGGGERPNVTGLGVFVSTPTIAPTTFAISPAQSNPDDDGLAIGQALTDTYFPVAQGGGIDTNAGIPIKVFAGARLQLDGEAVDTSWGAASPAPAVTAWSTSAGSISNSGLLQAPNAPGTTVTVTASNGSTIGSQMIEVIGQPTSITGPLTPLSFGSNSSSAQSLSLVARDVHGFAAPLDEADTTLSYDQSVISVSATADGGFSLTPVGDGSTTLTVSDDGASYSVPVVVGDGTATVSPGRPATDPAVATNDTTVGAPAAGAWRFGAVAGSEITATGDAGATQLTDAVQRAESDGDQLLFVDGDLTADGAAAQLTAADTALTAAGCSIVTGDPASGTPSAGSIPCIVLPGETDASADAGANGTFETKFGTPYRAFVENGTEFLTFDTSAGNIGSTDWDQVDGITATIDSVIANSSISRLVVMTSRPALSVPGTTSTGMTDQLDASGLDMELSQVAAAGKQAILVTGDAQTPDVSRLDGVIDVSLPSLYGFGASGPPAGNYEGQAAFDIGSGSSGLSIDMEPLVSSASLTAPSTVIAGNTGTVAGSFTLSDGNTLAAGFPASPQWVAGEGLAIGSGSSAVAAAKSAGDVAIFDPTTDTVTGLSTGTATLTVQADSSAGATTPVSASRTITVTPQSPVTLQNATLYFDAGAAPQASYVSSLAGAAVAGGGVISPIDLAAVDFDTPGVYDVEVQGTIDGAVAAPATLRIVVERAGSPLGDPTIHTSQTLLTYGLGADPTAAEVAGAAGAAITDGALNPIDLSGVDFTTAGTYSVTITGGDGNDSATPVTLTIVVVPKPVITAFNSHIQTTTGVALSSNQVVLAAGASTSEGQISPVDLSGVDWNTPGTYTVYLNSTYDGVTATAVPITIDVVAPGADQASAATRQAGTTDAATPAVTQSTATSPQTETAVSAPTKPAATKARSGAINATAAPSVTRLTVTNTHAEMRKAGTRIRVKVTTHGKAASGRVRLYDGTRLIKTVTLKRGRATATIRRPKARGALRAVYLGSRAVNASHSRRVTLPRA